MMLEISNLNFSYGSKPLLKDINISFDNSNFIGILGPNGSGKSTLLKNLLGYYKYDSGKISLLNKDLKDYSIKELAKIIGFLPQNSALLTPLNVIDVLLMSRYVGLKYSFMDYSKEDILEVKNIAKILKFENLLYRNILSLSGGEFQRVLLARALLKNPKVLFLDEPTSALDLNYAIELLNLCESLIKEKNIKIIAILHDLNLASLYCDEIIFIKDGEIRYQGEVKELFTKEILKEIYNFNCEIINKNGKAYILPLKERK